MSYYFLQDYFFRSSLAPPLNHCVLLQKTLQSRQYLTIGRIEKQVIHAAGLAVKTSISESELLNANQASTGLIIWPKNTSSLL